VGGVFSGAASCRGVIVDPLDNKALKGRSLRRRFIAAEIDRKDGDSLREVRPSPESLDNLGKLDLSPLLHPLDKAQAVPFVT
jgi:hypothetical protein